MDNECNCNKPTSENKQKLYTIILRHDTSTEWDIENPVLALGEYGVEDDTHKVKRGNGKDRWKKLPYETFGLKYMISFGNLSGEISDNEKLSNAINDKLSISSIESAGGNLVSEMRLINNKDSICTIKKKTLDVVSNNIDENTIMIKSSDNSIKGIWTTDDTGIKILDVTTSMIISDFIPKADYNENELCFYNNNLYKCNKFLESPESFNIEDWTLVTNTNAENILFDNSTTSLKSTTVQSAISELDNNVTEITSCVEWQEYE